MPQRLLSEAEYNAVKDRVLSALPNGLTEAEFTRQIGPRLEQALGEAENLPPQPEGSALGRFASSAGALLNPVTAIKNIWEAAPIPQALGGSGVIEGPRRFLAAQGTASLDQLKKSYDAAAQGRFTEAAGHLGGAIPLIGPAAAAAGEQIASGDIAGGLGTGSGLLAPAAIPAAVGAVAPATRAALQAAPGAERLAQTAEQASRENLARAISPTVGPNKVRFAARAAEAAPQLAREPGIGAWSRTGLAEKVGAKLEEAQQGLDAAAEQRLAGRAFPTAPVIAELEAKKARLTAEPVIGSRMVPEYVGSQTTSAPGGVSTPSEGPSVPSGPGGRAAVAELGPTATPAELERAYFTDAKRSGYPGSPAAFSQVFRPRLAQAQALADEMASIHQEYGPQALFQAIKQAGGIGEDAGYPGEITQLWENSTGYRQGKGIISGGSRVRQGRTTGSGGFAGVPGVLTKTGGRTLDDVATILRQDPRFEHITGPRVLLDAIDEARTAKNETPALSETLAATGVRPGAQWWADPEDVSFDVAQLEQQSAPPELRRVGRPLGQPVVPGPNAERVGAIQRVIDEVKQLGPLARYESLRRIRQGWDQVAKVRYNPSLTQDFLKVQGQAQGAMDATGVLRDALAKFDPATAKANAPYAFYKSVHDVIQAAEETDRARPTVGRRIMSRFMGATIGEHLGGLPGAIGGLLLGPAVDSAMTMAPTLRIQYSRALAQLADAIRGGQVDRASSLIQQLKTMTPSRRTAAIVGGNVMQPAQER